MTKLNASLSLFQITFLGVGTMVGAGIYVLVGKVAGISEGLTLWAFVAAAVIVSFSSYSHGFLAQNIPSSSGAAGYVQKAFNFPHLTVAVGLGVLLTGVVSSATLVNGFHGYLNEFILLPKWLVVTSLALILFFMASQKVSDSVNIAVAITFIELLGLVLVIVFSERGNFEPISSTPSVTIENVQIVLVGAFVAFYAYVGFEDMVNLAEEVKEPQKTMLPAIMLALVITSGLYLLVAWVAMQALPISELSKSDAPFAAILAHTPWVAKSVSVIGLIAIINGALVQILMGSRMLFGLSRDGHLPSSLSKLNRKSIPINATLITAAIIWIFALTLPLIVLAKLTSGIILIVFILVNASAAVIALKEKHYFATTIAIIGAILCLLFLTSGVVGGH